MKAKRMELMIDKSVENLTVRVNARLAEGWDFLPGFKATDNLRKFVIIAWEPKEPETVKISREAGPAAS